MIEHIKLGEDELAYLIRNLPFGVHVDCSFGPGGCCLKNDLDKPMRPDVRLLLLKRGILNENTDGAGI